MDINMLHEIWAMNEIAKAKKIEFRKFSALPEAKKGREEMSDYRERMKIEYYELKNRYDKLHTMLNKWEAGTLDFTPSCPKELLKRQKSCMGNYLNCLEIRAEIEGIRLVK